MTRITQEELDSLFEQRRLLLIHFSTPDASSPPHMQYPNNLRYVLTGRPEICCSTVTPEDTVDNSLGGIVGVVIYPLSTDDIKGVAAHDFGSDRQGDLVVVPHQHRDASYSACVGSLDRGKFGYNEWVISKYRTYGIFVVGEQLFSHPDGPPLQNLRDMFPGQRLFSQWNGSFVEIYPDNSRTNISTEGVYEFRSAMMQSHHHI